MDQKMNDRRIAALLKSGWAGIGRESGTIVDRRIFEDAVPIPQNQMMGVPVAKTSCVDVGSTSYHYYMMEQRILKSGWGGYTADGCIGDRRLDESGVLIPIPGVPEQGVPEPKFSQPWERKGETYFSLGAQEESGNEPAKYVPTDPALSGDIHMFDLSPPFNASPKEAAAKVGVAGDYKQKIEEIYNVVVADTSHSDDRKFIDISGPIRDILNEVFDERARQFIKWGVQYHDYATWIAILTEEVGEAAREAVDYSCENSPKDGSELSDEVQIGRLQALRKELIQVAAVAVQIIEAIDKDLED